MQRGTKSEPRAHLMCQELKSLVLNDKTDSGHFATVEVQSHQHGTSANENEKQGCKWRPEIT